MIDQLISNANLSKSNVSRMTSGGMMPTRNYN